MIARSLALHPNLVLLLGAIVLIGAGEEMWMRFLPKYLDALGASAFAIGLFDALQTWLGAVYAYPGGVAVDRWGHRRALTAFTAISIAGYAVMLLVPHWAAVLAAMFLFRAWSDLSLPATFSLVGASLPPARQTMGIAVQSLIKRVPIMVGPLAGGVLMDRYGIRGGAQAAFGVSIVLGLAALLVHRRLRAEAARPERLGGFLALVRGFDPRLRRLLFSDILIRFCERLPHAWVVIYALDRVGVTATQVGVLIAIEMVTAMACYLPVAHFADRFRREPFVIATFVFFTLFPVTLAMSASFGWLALAFFVRGLKEFGEPPRKALILSYAQPEAPARTVGAYYLLRDTVVAAGSFLGAALWKLGPGVNFWTAAVAGAAGTLAYVWSAGPRTATGTGDRL